MGARTLSIEDLLRVVRVTDPQISPDGTSVVYQSRQTLLEENKYSTDLWTALVNENDAPSRITNHEPDANRHRALRARWSPDGGRLAYLRPGGGIAVIQPGAPEAGSERTIEDAATHFDPGHGFNGDVHWSPDGKRVAFLRSEPPEQPEGPKTGVLIDLNKGSSIASQQVPNPSAVWTVDVESGAQERITDDSWNVKGFNWSPDGGRMVISALPSNEDDGGLYLESDLFILDLSSKKVETLLRQPGGDIGPVWSPDGEWIAFWSQMGSEKWGWSYISTPALIPAAGGDVRYPIADRLQDWATFYYLNDFMWTPDSKSFFFSDFYRLTTQLFRIDVGRDGADQVTRESDSVYGDFSFDGRTFAFTKQTLTSPPNIYVANADGFAERRISHSNPWWDEVQVPKVERLEWRSRDDKFDIQGYLMLPPDYKEGDSYPTIVEAVGGPSMTSMIFPDGLMFMPALLFATMGYVTFTPNTRGRSGGYGESFWRSVAEERDYTLNPLSDLLVGLETLVNKGLVDTERIGIMGHSYGGVMTGAALVHSDLFKAAAFHEGVVDFVSDGFKRVGSPYQRRHRQDQAGLGSPHEPDEQKRHIEQSSIYHAHKISAPVLIEAGELALAEQASLLAHALSFLEIPYEFVIYPRTGHVTTEPLLIKDEIERKVAWFGYWLKDETYPDPDRQSEFDRWRKLQEHEESQR